MHLIPRVAVLATAALALVAAGCGGKDTKKPSHGEKPAPGAKQSLSATMPDFNQAIATQSCQRYAPLACAVPVIRWGCSHIKR